MEYPFYSVEPSMAGRLYCLPYRPVQAWQLEGRGRRQVLGGERGGDGGGVGGRLQLLVLLGPGHGGQVSGGGKGMRGKLEL